MKQPLLLILLAFLLVSACKKNRDVKDNNIDSTKILSNTEISDDTISYKQKSVLYKSGPCPTLETNCVYYEAEYPLLNKTANNNASKSINYFISKIIDLKDIQSSLDEQYSENLELVEESEWNPSSFNFDFIGVETNLNCLFSLSHYSGGYAVGAAHGYQQSNYYHFNPKTGKKLTMRDFFIAGFEKKLKPICQKRFTKLIKELNGENADQDFDFIETFHFSGKGLIFTYGEYEIAAYAFGHPELLIPFSEIKSLLKEEFLSLLTLSTKK